MSDDADTVLVKRTPALSLEREKEIISSVALAEEPWTSHRLSEVIAKSRPGCPVPYHVGYIPIDAYRLRQAGRDAEANKLEMLAESAYAMSVKRQAWLTQHRLSDGQYEYRAERRTFVRDIVVKTKRVMSAEHKAAIREGMRRAKAEREKVAA